MSLLYCTVPVTVNWYIFYAGYHSVIGFPFSLLHSDKILLFYCAVIGAISSAGCTLQRLDRSLPQLGWPVLMKRTCSENSTLRFSLDTELKFWVGSQCLSLISWRNVDKSKERVKVSREAQKNATKYQIAALAFVTNDLKPHLSSSCSSLGNINISCENLLFFKKEKKEEVSDL